MTRSLRVRDFMSTDLATASPDTEIMNAVRQLVERDISGLMVVDDDSRLIGILTERDCIDVALRAGYHDEAGGKVGDFMTTDVSTIDPDASLMDLAQTFANSSFRRCPVVRDGRLVGLICRRDVLRALNDGNWFSAPDTSRRSS